MNIRMPNQDPYSTVNFRELYDSSLSSLKESILTGIAEFALSSKNLFFNLSPENAIKVGKWYVIGACVDSDYIRILFDKKKKMTKQTRAIVPNDEQEDEAYKAFDSNIENWLLLIERSQKEFFA